MIFYSICRHSMYYMFYSMYAFHLGFSKLLNFWFIVHTGKFQSVKMKVSGQQFCIVTYTDLVGDSRVYILVKLEIY